MYKYYMYLEILAGLICFFLVICMMSGDRGYIKEISDKTITKIEQDIMMMKLDYEVTIEKCIPIYLTKKNRTTVECIVTYIPIDVKNESTKKIEQIINYDGGWFLETDSVIPLYHKAFPPLVIQ